MLEIYSWLFVTAISASSCSQFFCVFLIMLCSWCDWSDCLHKLSLNMNLLLSRHLHCQFFLVFCLFSSPTWAQTIQQALWKIPDGSQPDFSTTFTEGNTVPLAWNALAITSYLDTIENLVDLWVTAYDTSLNPVARRIIRRFLRQC